MRGLQFELPRAGWEPAPAEYEPVEYGSAFPPVSKLADGRLVIDQSLRADGGYDVKVFDNADAPQLALLPANAPRAVKAIFRREWRLRYLRSTDATSVMNDINRACEAWAKFEAAC